METPMSIGEAENEENVRIAKTVGEAQSYGEADDAAGTSGRA